MWRRAGLGCVCPGRVVRQRGQGAATARLVGFHAVQQSLLQQRDGFLIDRSMVLRRFTGDEFLDDMRYTFDEQIVIH